MNFNIEGFYQFCQDKYKLARYAGKMKDGREKPRIKSSVIFLSMIFMVAWQRKSFLQLDQLLRLEVVKKYLKSKKKNVVSDTTIQDTLKVFAINPIRNFLYQVYQKSKEQYGGRVEIGNKRLRLGAIDGSCFGKFFASCFLAIGQKTNLFLDAQKMEKRGKELPTSQKLLERLVNKLGKNFIDILLLDGLYFAQNFINFSTISCSIDVLCKTSEETLSIIQDANGIFFKQPLGFFPDLEYQAGFDDMRLCSFRIWACGGFTQPGIHKLLKVARIDEFYPKLKKQETFYVISTVDDLNALELRELGHIRWKIENEGFKHLNALAHTKRVFTHHPHAFLSALLIFFCAFNLINLFSATLDRSFISAIFGNVKFTSSLVCFVLLISLFFPFSLDSPPL